MIHHFTDLWLWFLRAGRHRHTTSSTPPQVLRTASPYILVGNGELTVERFSAAGEEKRPCGLPSHIHLTQPLNMVSGTHNNPRLLVAALPVRPADFSSNPQQSSSSVLLPGPCALRPSLNSRHTLPGDFRRWEKGEFSARGKSCWIDALRCACLPFNAPDPSHPLADCASSFYRATRPSVEPSEL